jgi:hypothetical protein
MSLNESAIEEIVVGEPVIIENVLSDSKLVQEVDLTSS